MGWIQSNGIFLYRLTFRQLGSCGDLDIDNMSLTMVPIQRPFPTELSK